MSEKIWEIDDRSFVRITKEAEEKRRQQGIVREGPPDFDAVAARWKARRAADEEAGTLKTYRFVILTQLQDGQFCAYAPTLNGCEARDATPEEAREQLLKMLYVRLAEMLAAGETPPSDEGAEIVNIVLPTASHTVDRYDDRRMKERTVEYRERLRASGVEEPAPDFAAAAARWKARRAAGEEAGTLKTFRFVILTQPQDGRFRAYAPTLDGCEARGATPEEAREQLLKALYVRLAEMLAGGETPPSDEGAEIVNIVLPTASPSTE